MSEDARNSLIAYVYVTAFVTVLALFLWLMRDAELPSWTLFAVLGINVLIVLTRMFRWQRRRPRPVRGQLSP